MRVLVVTVVHTPLDGRIHDRQIRAMVSAGWQVSYAAPWTAFGTEPAEAVPGLRRLDLPRASGRHRLAAIRAARRLLRREAPAHDVVLLHDPELIVAVLGRRRMWGPVVLDVHEDLAASLTDRSWLPGPIRRPVRFGVRVAERWAERRLHLLLAERAYQSRFARRHPLVRNLPWLRPGPPAPLRQAVVYVGRLSRARGVVEMIELGRRLQALGGPDVELVGAADADVEGLLVAADDRGEVRWRGFLPSQRALEVVEGAVAGLSLLHDEPNYRVSLPTKLVEYLACGVPVITTPLPEAAALVDASGVGVVVPFGEVDAVIDAVRDLAGDESRRLELATRARSFVADGWSWDEEAGTFLTSLEQVSMTAHHA